MSIDVSIKQKGFFKKTMPLKVILGNHLSFGCYGKDGICLDEEEPVENYFIAYNKNHIGRGFTVDWTENEKDEILLRASTPCHPEELNDFFDAVKRMTDYWKCELEVDGDITNPDEFLSKREEFQNFNVNFTKKMINETASGLEDSFIMPCVMFPLVLGKVEAVQFKDNVGDFFQWLHDRQTIDAYYGIPQLYQNRDRIVSMYVLTEKTRSIFPTNPEEQLKLINLVNQNEIFNDEELLSLYSITEEKVIGTIPYHRFLEFFLDKCERFDDRHILINEVSLEEMEELKQFEREVKNKVFL